MAKKTTEDPIEIPVLEALPPSGPPGPQKGKPGMALRLVYVAGPYTAPTPRGVKKNISLARHCARAVAEVPGLFPVVPHQLGIGIEEVGDYAYWIEATLEVMRRCDAVYAIPGWEKSKGAVGEVKEAKRLGLPVLLTQGHLIGFAASKAKR